MVEPLIFLTILGVCFEGLMLAFSSSSPDGGAKGRDLAAFDRRRRKEPRNDTGRNASTTAVLAMSTGYREVVRPEGQGRREHRLRVKVQIYGICAFEHYDSRYDHMDVVGTV